MKKKNCRRENRGERIMDSISRSLDLPADAVSGYAHIELSGNKEAIIEGCCGVLEYSDSVIALNTGRLTVRVCGCELTIVSMQNGQVIIKGIITGLDYCN
ncbi:MAG: YabP/YqfC family sporulation protein [Clostridia bacterium]|nr:YabP/YqfC family sporulation protein [Clostridia bacterium]